MKTDFQNQIILRLKELREEHNISQANMAQLLGISTGQLGNIESYKRAHKYTLKQIMTLCDKYNIEIIHYYK